MKYDQAHALRSYACDLLSRYSENYLGEINRDCDAFINENTNIEFYVIADCNGYYLQGVCYHAGNLVALVHDLKDRAYITKFLVSLLDRFFVPVHGIRQMTILEALQNDETEVR